MGVWLIQKEDVESRIDGEGEDAQPLEKPSPLNHYVPLVVAGDFREAASHQFALVNQDSDV